MVPAVMGAAPPRPATGVLGQAVHNARYRPNVSSSLRARQQLAPPEFVASDRMAQARLHNCYRTLVALLEPVSRRTEETTARSASEELR